MKIIGYANKFSVAKNEIIEFKVSCKEIKKYNAEICKIIQGDINPQGPGYKEIKLKYNLAGPFDARYQRIPIGSYGIVKNKKNFNKLNDIAISVCIFPTLLNKRKKQIIVSRKSAGKIGFDLFINSNDQIEFSINSSNIKITKKLMEKKWYFINASYNKKTGLIYISYDLFCDSNDKNSSVEHKKLIRKGINFKDINENLFIAANYENNLVKNFYNGKIDSLKIFNKILLKRSNKSLPSPLANWDFSKFISTDKIYDKSLNKLHGKLINHPARAVTGYKWSEKIRDWKMNSSCYSAIHFHEDDLTDCNWLTDFKFKIPIKMKSGIYAVRLFSKDSEFYIPFCVRPGVKQKKNKILFLLPTSSYLAYANNRMGIDVPDTELVCGRLIEINEQDVFLQEHPEVGLSFYDLHEDGSPVFYSSKKRPIINFQPKSIGKIGGVGSNVWQFNADTHITGWLDNFGYDFDVVTDEDLHKDSYECIKNYSVIITGTHPEYYSLKMIEAMQQYTNNGGRLMYLGGNGFYWRISYDKNSSDIIECRKSEGGIRAVETDPGESYASTTGEYSGLWRRNGIPPNQLTGVGMVSQGFDISSAYHRTRASYHKKVKFIFNKVKEKIIGDFGLSGGGAAGLEIDSANKNLGSPDNIFILASSKKHTDVYLMTPEDMLDPVPGLGGTEAEMIKSDMIFFETKKNGAVFSVGSIAWAGSMAWNNYKNGVSKITRNVLNRFLNPRKFS